MNNLGFSYRTLGDMREAVSCYERALAIKEQVYQDEPNHPELAKTLESLGKIWLTLKDLRKFKSFFERAQAIKKASNHP